MATDFKKSVSPEDQSQINEFAREHKHLVDLRVIIFYVIWNEFCVVFYDLEKKIESIILNVFLDWTQELDQGEGKLWWR